MKLRANLLACAGLAVLPLFSPAVRAVDTPLRLSSALSPTERTSTGLNRLTSDQVAILDALYRRDLVAQAAPRRADAPPLAARFSQRLSADERASAGLSLLTEEELTQLDALAERSGNASLARTLLAQPTFIPVSMRARIAETELKRKGPEIHGSFTIGMAVGSGGYSERFGGMTLTYEDPVRNFAVSFSYAESHVKGGNGYYPYLSRDPLTNSDVGLGLRYGDGR
ncbi:MAG: hypothetical protein NTV51_23360 [Verrucomicrobia bacterium]|nr:hypothetical protein [Verrucomicrobiota bacterium]